MPDAQSQRRASLNDCFDALVTAKSEQGAQAALTQYIGELTREVELERARRDSAPRITLREHGIPDWPGLDDVVVEHPTMYRAEFMSENDLWMCCYFPEPHERITFHVQWDKRLKCLRMDAGEMPDKWTDIDHERRRVSAT